MKSTHLKKILSLFIALILYSQVLGQDEKPKDKLYVMHVDVVKIDKVSQYEENVKKEIELWKKHGMETTIEYASKSDDNQFHFLTPLSSYGDLEKQGVYWENFTKKAGEETIAELYSKYEDTYISHKNVVIKQNVALSYWPENSSIKRQEVKFLHFDHYSFKEGKIEEGMKMFKEFKDLMTKKKSTDPYTVWTSDIGGNLGEVVVVRPAKSNIGHYEAANKRMESMAEEFKEMWPRFSKTLKSFSHNNGVPKPEFLYSPGK